MFEPRPEISTATRDRSAMVAGRPVFGCAPGAGAALYRAALVARLDPADPMDSLPRNLQPFGYLGFILRRDNRHHPNAAVESPRKLSRFDRAAGLEEGEQARQGPFVRIDHGMGAFRQHARDILQQSAAGDMGKRANPSLAHQRQQAFHIDSGWLEQRLSKQPLLVEQGWTVELPAVDLDQPANQRKAIGMDPRADEPEDHIARRNP